MTLSSESLLALVILGFYLKDCVLLLQPNQAVLVRGLGGRWRAGFGARNWRLRGREPYLANPFMPHEPVVRLQWQMTGGDGKSGTREPCPVELPVAVMRLGVFAWISWLELFVLIPATLTGRIAGLTPIVAISMLYVNILASLIATWFWRRPLGLSGKTFLTMAFECLVCAPYAANLVRRVATARPIDEDFTVASQRLLDMEQIDVVKRECLARIDERIESEVADGVVMNMLQSSRVRFVVEDDDERR